MRSTWHDSFSSKILLTLSLFPLFLVRGIMKIKATNKLYQNIWYISRDFPFNSDIYKWSTLRKIATNIYWNYLVALFVSLLWFILNPTHNNLAQSTIYLWVSIPTSPCSRCICVARGSDQCRWCSLSPIWWSLCCLTKCAWHKISPAFRAVV